jgi:hypothetical protein
MTFFPKRRTLNVDRKPEKFRWIVKDEEGTVCGLISETTSEWSGFELRQGQSLSFSLVVQTRSGAHPTANPRGVGYSFRRSKAAGA